MTLLEKLRGFAFNTLDGLKGGNVSKALSVIKNCDNGTWSREQIEQYQTEQLEKLLEHSKNTVPFYKSQKGCNLSDWPVVNKSVFKDNEDKCISSEYNKDDLIVMSTSGSTGTPFASYQNVIKKKHVNAETLYYNGKIGFTIGRRIIYLRSIVSEVQKSSLKQFSQNIYLLDCNDLSDKGIKAKLEFIEKYSKGCGAMLMGYASTFKAFSDYFSKYGFKDAENANIYGVVSGSEMLYDSVRNNIETAFKCKCVSRYANEENGFIGQDEEENNVFLVDTADYYVEVLKLDSDETEEAGKVGRIVVTDLFNYAMPMIRYDTGDLGALTFLEKDGQKRLAITSFSGRKVDTVTDCNGNLVSPNAITNLMWQYKDIKQFQFIQKDYGKYVLILNLSVEDYDYSPIVNDIKRIFGTDSEISVEFTSDIPVLSSGKRRYIVNEMINKV